MHRPNEPRMSKAPMLAAFTLAAGLLLSGSVKGSAPDAAVSIGSGSVNPGGTITVALDTRNVSGLGAITIDVIYDPAVIDAVACNGDPAKTFDLGSCNEGFGPGRVRFTGISSQGLSGGIRLADITFQAIGELGEASNLDAHPVTFADINGQTIPVTDEDGSITISGAASPAPGPDSFDTTGDGAGQTSDPTGQIPAREGAVPQTSPATDRDEAGPAPPPQETSTPGPEVRGEAAEQTPTPPEPAPRMSSGAAESDDDGIPWWVWLAASLGGAAVLLTVGVSAAIRWRGRGGS